PEPHHAHWMQEMDRREGEDRRDKDDGEGDIFAGFDDEDREHNHVPDYRKALEEVLARLDACVDVLDRAGTDDDRSRKHDKPSPHEAALIKGEGGNENVGDVVDDVVEHVARPRRQYVLDLQLARDRTVDSVN